jgi:pyruvate-formate lyase-activating enzyme
VTTPAADPTPKPTLEEMIALLYAKAGSGRYRSCAWIEEGVFVTADEVKSCCMQHIGSEPSTLFSLKDSDTSGRRIIERRYQLRLANQSAAAPCKGCYSLKEKNWEAKDYLRFVAISGFLHCNLSCTYCVSYANNPSDRGGQVLDKLKQWYDEGLLREGSFLDFGGGESTLHREFDAIAEFSFARGIRMVVYTNATGVSPPLLDGLAKGLADVVCSVDAGTSETYRQIKGRPMLDRVWASLSTYAAAATDNKSVVAKYIVMERNRSKEEIDAFFERAEKAKVKKFFASVNAFQNTQAKGELPDLSLRAIAYFLQRGREAGTALASDLFSVRMGEQVEAMAALPREALIDVLGRRNDKGALELSYSDGDTFSARAETLLQEREKFVILLPNAVDDDAVPERLQRIIARATEMGAVYRTVPPRGWTAIEIEFVN